MCAGINWKRSGQLPNPLQDKLKTLNAEEVAQIYKNLFSSIDGQLLLEDLKNRCFYFAPLIDEHEGRTYFNDGMRSVVLHITNQIEYQPEEKESESQ